MSYPIKLRERAIKAKCPYYNKTDIVRNDKKASEGLKNIIVE